MLFEALIGRTLIAADDTWGLLGVMCISVALSIWFSIPSTVIPVMPGRNLAVIIETAAINNRQKKMGYNAAKELLARLGLEDDTGM